MRYNTVIFDLDGTLLDTLVDLMNATNYALERYGYPKRTLPEIRQFVGNGVQKLLERSLPGGEGSANPQAAGILAAFREHYTLHCEDNTRPYQGIQELLEQLSRGGVRMAIVSNKLDSAVKALNKSHFQNYVPVAIGEKEGVRRKPAPDMVLTALKELGSSAAEAVYVGDSDVDLQTAANSGLDCISVSWGFRDTALLKEKGASVIVNTPQQIYELIMGKSNPANTQ